DVGYVGDIRHVPYVGDIHLLEVRIPVVIPREKRFSRSQGKPGLDAEADSNRKTRAADERHQRRRIHRHDGHRPRQPSPGRPYERPAPVVERAKAPGFVFDPGPTPRIDPHPVAKTIRHPAYGHTGWEPDWSISSLVLPAAVVVEVVITRDIAADVARG